MPAGEPPLGALVAPEPAERPDLWPTTARRGDDGQLVVGGRSVSEIVADAPTPVYVLDEADMRGRASVWASVMAEEFWPDYGMNGGDAFYAGKAFLTTRVARWMLSDGLGIDTASRVELAIGLAALTGEGDGSESFPPSRLGLHGNGKTAAEVAMAVQQRLGHLVVDSPEEIAYAAEAVRRLRAEGIYGPDERAGLMVRLTTGIHAGGHEFISTAHEDQKFGLSVHTGAARAAIDAIIAAPELELRGLHSHIGSQITDPAGFEAAAEAVLRLRHEVAADTGVLCEEIDLGGGLGIAYTGADAPAPSPAALARALAAVVRRLCDELGDAIPHVSVEPGRSIAGPAQVTLYTVTGLKRVELGQGASRLYVSVDGGMSDNLRPALYGADYTALLAGRRPDPAVGLVRSRLVGKHCESGDIVVRDVDLPADLAIGDVLAVPATGAYGRSMAMNYNLFTRPGVAWVRDGRQGWILRPETVEDLIALEGE
ncbi:diaminopimelate decarboxylase [Actinomyces gaoshouyii]|uniref:diaminopimelate decarboxylase n=1 Tax=Actinomyces gaoshouyii TaxID=1960083 RepID=UPI0009B50655|nr:diaminopimelate decarboxylase [Actinomyces gaoshouyii]ARD42677.1 diaminopimelate decarboxylase [Actinomyces gaoshouyii]